MKYQLLSRSVFHTQQFSQKGLFLASDASTLKKTPEGTDLVLPYPVKYSGQSRPYFFSEALSLPFHPYRFREALTESSMRKKSQLSSPSTRHSDLPLSIKLCVQMVTIPRTFREGALVQFYFKSVFSNPNQDLDLLQNMYKSIFFF